MKRRPSPVGSSSASSEAPPVWMRYYDGRFGSGVAGWRVWQRKCREWADAHGWHEGQLLGLWHPSWIDHGWADSPPVPDPAEARLAQLRSGGPGPNHHEGR